MRHPSGIGLTFDGLVNEETAKTVIANWLAEARASVLEHFLRLAQTIEDHWLGYWHTSATRSRPGHSRV